MAAHITKQLDDLKIDNKKDINVLLLGETGVGKSTFINSIANYLHFQDFKVAEKAKPLILIPSTIIIRDENFEEKVIKIGKTDKNEYQEIGESATQEVKTYVFPIGEGKLRLRLIDTPGMGDTRGIQQDDLNCENILAYLSNLKELHAICFLMKPTNTRITILFEYCVKQILSRLEKSASNNLIFIFTNTRGTNYTGGDTLPCLQKIIDQIHTLTPNIKIPLKNNVFCFDNEAFRFLMAIKNDIKIVQKSYFIESWNKSVKQCWTMIYYIIGDLTQDPLKPHQIKNTVSINEARRLILQLCKPLAEINELIIDNIRILERHQQKLSKSDQTVNELKKKLFVPVVNLEVTELSQPVTVCTAAKCSSIYQVGSVSKWHYRQRCHDPCYLQNVQKEIIGDPGLANCAAMNNKTCTLCNCDFSVHMHVYYFTKTVDDKIINDTVQSNIDDEYQVIKSAQEVVIQISNRMKEYETERNTITKILVKFAYFLKNNALTPYNDAYQRYIKYLIEREERLGPHADENQLKALNAHLDQYGEEKKAFENVLNLSKIPENNTNLSEMKPSDIMMFVNQLYSLKYNGNKIRELLQTQKSSRNFEYKVTCEYTHPQVVTKIKEKEKKETQNKNKKNPKKNADGNNERNNKPPQRSVHNSSYMGHQRERPPAYHEVTQNHSFPQHNYNNRRPQNARTENFGSNKNPNDRIKIQVEVNASDLRNENTVDDTYVRHGAYNGPYNKQPNCSNYNRPMYGSHNGPRNNQCCDHSAGAACNQAHDNYNRRLNEGNYRPNKRNYRPNEGNYRPNEGNYRPNEGNYRPNEGNYRPEQNIFTSYPYDPFNQAVPNNYYTQQLPANGCIQHGSNCGSCNINTPTNTHGCQNRREQFQKMNTRGNRPNTRVFGGSKNRSKSIANNQFNLKTNKQKSGNKSDRFESDSSSN